MQQGIDPQAIAMQGGNVPPTSPPCANMPCIGAEGGIIEGGGGSAAEGNAQMGTQLGGGQEPTGSRLVGW